MYNVVILAEQPLTAGDAQEVVSLHEDIEDTRHYFVLLPCENAARGVQAALGSSHASDVLLTTPMLTGDFDVDEAQRQIDDEASSGLDASVQELRSLGVEASGEFSSHEPIDRLTEVVADRQAAEVIVMTLHHSVSELFHLDWTSKARRRLGVPILHLLEHEPLDAEADNGQGITGM